MEGKIDKFGNSVVLMLFIYVLAAVVSYLVAGVIKLTFAGVKSQKARATARAAAASQDAGNNAPKGAG